MSKESRAARRQERIAQEWSDLYRAHVEQHERDLQAEQNRNAEQFSNPAFAASLGLPPELPQHTIDILKHTMALSRLEPTRPKRSKYASDMAPTALHACNLR